MTVEEFLYQHLGINLDDLEMPVDKEVLKMEMIMNGKGIVEDVHFDYEVNQLTLL